MRIRIRSKFFLLLFLASNCFAETDSVNVTVQGEIVSKPLCYIDNNKTIEIDFGNNIGINKISTGNYREKVPFEIKCDGTSDDLQLTLKVSGKPASFDADNASVISAEQQALGVKIFQNGEPFKLETAVPINIDNIPEIVAVLVSDNDSELIEGEFNAVASLQAEYQ